VLGELEQAIEGKSTWDIYTLIKNEKVIEHRLIVIQDEDGYTILHWAATQNNLPFIELLEDQGEDIAIASHDGTTALHIAAFHGHEEIVLWLLKEGIIDINAADDYQRTPLYFAAIGGYAEIILALIIEGADQSFILHIAARHNTVQKIIKALSQEAIDVYKNFQNEKKQTPLHIAVLCGHIDAIQSLCEKGVEVNECDVAGYTPLDIAQEKQLQEKDTDQKKKYQLSIDFLLEKRARNGKGLVNTISLFLYHHSGGWPHGGYVLAFWTALCLFKIKLIYLIYGEDNPASIPIAENAIALLQNLTQESAAPTIHTTNEMICRLNSNAENEPFLECYEPQQKILTHIFSKETPTSESITVHSVETAISTFVTISSGTVNEYELTGDTYNIRNCKPVEYFGHKSLYCEGEKTTFFTTMIKKSDPLDLPNILNVFNSALMLAIFSALLIRFLYEEYISIPEKKEKKLDLIILSENDSDVQDFFQSYIRANNEQSKAESEDCFDMEVNDKSEPDPDPFRGMIVNREDKTVQTFFQIAEERLKQIEESIPKTEDEISSFMLNRFFSKPRKSWIKNDVICIRESLEDLKEEEKQILKSDLYYIALDIHDLKTRKKSNEQDVSSSSSDIFVPGSFASLPPVI
jgi:ankyrin repeat protein